MCAAFSCFADLALVSPQDYRLEGQGSLLQCVLTPADPFMPLANEDIAAHTHQQVGHGACLSKPLLVCVDVEEGCWWVLAQTRV